MNKIHKVVLTGPESTGKSKLTEQLANHFKVDFVPEFARSYIDELDQPYQEKDLLLIAKGQVEAEKMALANGRSMIFCDTDLITIKIWAEYKYGRCDPWITHQLNLRKADLYLLCSPDLPWTEDPQRENRDDRTELFKLYQQSIQSLDVPFNIINGKGAIRLQNAIEIIRHFSFK